MQESQKEPTAVRGVMVCTGNVSFRREDYLAAGGFDRTLDRSEDRELGLRLQKAGAKLYFAQKAVGKLLSRATYKTAEAMDRARTIHPFFERAGGGRRRARWAGPSRNSAARAGVT